MHGSVQPVPTEHSTVPPRSNVNPLLVIGFILMTVLAVVATLVAFLVAGRSDDATVSTADTGQSPEAIAPAPTAAPATGTGTSSAPPAASSVVTALAGQAPAVFDVTGIAAGSSLNVRSAAGTTSPLIGTLVANTTGIASTGRRVSVDGSEWREIRFNGGVGWVFAGYLAPAKTSTTPASPAPAPTAETVVDLDDDAPATYRVVGVTPGSSLNVRAEPGRTSRLLGTLPANTAIVPTTGERAMVSQTEWRQITFRDGNGWVDASFLERVAEVPPTILLPTERAASVAIAPLTSVNDRLVLRAEPGYDQSIVGTVGSSTTNVTSTGRRAQIASERWSEIEVFGRTGWVPAQLLITSPTSAESVLESSGVAAVTIERLGITERNTVVFDIGDLSVESSLTATVRTETGAVLSVIDWASDTVGPIDAEVTVVGRQITRLWIPGSDR